ncbi:ATPase, T2SS/T4P/T4SS family [Cytobacillus purgationiresistens]|uniref:Pilus assembly protein CpaF n=1 Tax=Cytobacillus purgationiresistens TaxID=863449 RepID=A0ABU0AIX3_9BACI|nr:ATPase, T2SS/T4P/T4SS family [Cytobacillus purgationiresistens]MDQ0271214.1 pilus assembly protein CpaF [Cytobacillus purgationiresistens]
MSLTLNLALILIILLICIIYLWIKIVERKDKRLQKDDEEAESHDYQFANILEHVIQTINQLTISNLLDHGLSEDEYWRRKRKQDELLAALKTCNTGNISDKNYVKNFISDLLLKTYSVNNDNINYAISFDHAQALSIRDKFDILLHAYETQYGNQALRRMIEKYQLDEKKRIDGEERYIITEEEIDSIFQKEYNSSLLSFDDKLAILTQKIFAHYKGFGVIDQIRDMNIDGVSGGVSGLPRKMGDLDDVMNIIDKMKSTPLNVDSIWIMFRGKSINLSFLSFGTAAELKRVVQTAYKYNTPGQLSESRPYIVNDMEDGSRVVVVRPPFAESWAFFIRKFDIPNAKLETLFNGENVDVVIELLKYLMAGCQITGITGAQGSGKTTLLMALIKYIDPTQNLRIQEMAFELHARKIYPGRNILSFQETSHVSGQEGLDLQKKTDGSVNILGEVATDAVAAWMIQMSQVASLFTVFTHHAKTFPLLIDSLRNSLLKVGMFNNEKIAEQQVVNVLNFNIHLDNRNIERITECIPVDSRFNYPTEWRHMNSSEDKMTAFMETMTEYFTRQTDPVQYEERNIIEYRNGKYIAVNPISDKAAANMMKHFNDEQAKAFIEFIGENWREGNVA